MFMGPAGGRGAGSFPASARKFKGAHPRRILEAPTRDPDGMRFSLGASATRAAQTSLRGMESIAGGPARRPFAAQQSETAKWRPGLRRVAPPKDPGDRGRGLRSIEAPNPADLPPPERVHFPKKWNRRTHAAGEFAAGQGLGAKIRVRDAKGVPCSERQAAEQDVSRVFGRKKRVDPSATGTLRNGIGVSRPGDKRYSHPDYSPDFFKGGGVYPGSNWGHQKALKPYHTTQFAAAAQKAQAAEAAALSGKMTYEQRRQYAIIRKEIEEVRALNPESNDGETWEQRTGRFTVAPPTAAPAADEGEGEGEDA